MQPPRPKADSYRELSFAILVARGVRLSELQGLPQCPCEGNTHSCWLQDLQGAYFVNLQHLHVNTIARSGCLHLVADHRVLQKTDGSKEAAFLRPFAVSDWQSSAKVHVDFGHCSL